MKIVWAVDPFSAKGVPLGALAKYFQALGGGKTELVPAYVASPAAAELSMAFDVPEKSRFSSYPKSLLVKALAQHRVQVSERNLHVLTEGSTSMKAACDRLIALALKEKADAIAVFSHSNKGVKRIVLGSFAETLVHRSPVSVLVFNPKCRVPEHVDGVLFATDLSTRASRTLDQIVDVLPKGRRLVFFHAIAPLRPPSELAPMGLVEGVADLGNSKTAAAARRSLDKLAQYATAKGLDTEIRWQESERRPADLILKHAKAAKAGLIVVTAQAGPVKALFLGSVTRDLLRSSTLPVWVVRA